MKVYILLLILVIALTSCDTEPVDTTAKLVTIEELKNSPGYDWFQPYYDTYFPNPNIIDSIKALFKADIHKFIIYARPVCSSCDTSIKPFPQLIKALHSANINDSAFEIYSCRTTTSSHPYKEIFKINSFPTAFLMENNSVKYSIIDTLNYYRINKPTGSYSVEQFILSALKGK